MKRKRTKITSEIVDKINQLWNAGASYQAIQDELGICHRTVHRHLKKDNGKYKQKNTKLTKETKDKVIKLFKQGKINSEISFDLRISVAAVLRILRRAGLIPLQHDISIIQRCKELRKQGCTIRDISQELKLSNNDTCWYIKM